MPRAVASGSVPAHEGGQGRHYPDRVSRMTSLERARLSPCRPGPVPGGRLGPDRATLMRPESGGTIDKEITSHTKIYLANWPSC